ncbi:AhpC/TSA family protein [Pedobacter chinensis]|uniref:AhpC/TSA family protein n=1 Tax=Pedobacter chinensis TaxID=2282421 RepID=A0A369PTL3_9SPHI|nr:TlpA disulfide reductase family protein [Pedobacter chinensis]RDC55913.1 AhpC/TSA family protein [Pedobacter chinensis]
MKKLMLAVLTLLTVGSKAQDKFTITGSLLNAGTDKKLILTYVNEEGKNSKDSTLLQNGKFSFNGFTAFGNRAYLELKPAQIEAGKKNHSDFKEFYLEKGNTIVTGRDSISKSSITGTKVQSENLAYHEKIDPLQAQYKKIVDRYYKAKAAKDSIELKQISIDAKPIMTSMEATLDEFIAANPDSYLAADLVLANKMAVIDVVKFEPIYNNFSKKVLSSFTGKKITEKFTKAKQFAIGKTIDFTLPDAEGVPFQLSSLKGKYVLVDFWASWCVPCRAENPFLLKAYTELKDKNFEIVGVSLDDKRANWLAAVAADKMPWTQVSDVKGFKTEVALRFGITAIPQNVLIDPSGKVIAKDLRGENVNKLIAAYIK